MAQDKKSVLLYCDIIHTVEKMDDETAGMFFKHYLRYVNDLNPETDNIIVDIAFESVKQNLKRDLVKWSGIKEKRSESGRKGGLAKQANARSAKKNLANQAVTVNANVTVKDNVIKKERVKKKFTSPTIPELQSYFLEKTSDYSYSKKEASKFFNFYEAKNWMIGKNKMQKWKAAVANWLSRDQEWKKEKDSKNTKTGTASEEYLDQLPEEVRNQFKKA